MIDLIRRQAALNQITAIDTSIIPYARAREYVDELKNYVIKIIETLPSAEPERKDGKWLNLDALISEQNGIMKKNFDKKDKDPEASLRFGMARSIKTYLFRKYAEQNNTEFCGNWETGIDGKERCSICWTPKKYSDINGKCVICAADMRGE